MDILYGAIAIIASMVISKYFNKPSEPRLRIFIKAAASEFILISALGWVFYGFSLGFFANEPSLQTAALRIFGFAGFLAVITGFKASNRLLEER